MQKNENCISIFGRMVLTHFYDEEGSEKLNYNDFAR